MIYCLEDEESIQQLMLYTLQLAGFSAEGFSESRAFWEAMDRELPELVLLDIMLPGEDGITILKKLRSSARTERLPVIMATAKGSEYDRVTGLDLGADDYLSKPFGMLEMVSRIKAVLRRAQPQGENDLLVCGPISMDRSAHVVRAGDTEISLTRKEFELLKLLMENPGIVFSRDRLLQLVWDFNYGGGTRTVDVHIGTLRTKLGPCGDLIRTIRGAGYLIDKADLRKAE